MQSPVTTINENQFKCGKCKELRELPLHLHELALFSELLLNEHIVYERKRQVVLENGVAQTKSIAKWLRLASQLERVDLNLFRYEAAHLYCEPVSDMLDSKAKHHESIITPLTRFVYVSNALEECYRFSSPAYEMAYERLRRQSPKSEYLRNYSAQAAYLLESRLNSAEFPMHYEHLVENYRKIIKLYADQFHSKFDMDLDVPHGLSYGLCLVRNIRNQIAHGSFPIIDDPEYTFEFEKPHVKRNLINLLSQSSRIAALNIQLLLTKISAGFASGEYQAICEDDSYGKYFEKNCTFSYLLNLHLIQKFGLNESDYFSLSTDWSRS